MAKSVDWKLCDPDVDRRGLRSSSRTLRAARRSHPRVRETAILKTKRFRAVPGAELTWDVETLGSLLNETLSLRIPRGSRIGGIVLAVFFGLMFPSIAAVLVIDMLHRAAGLADHMSYVLLIAGLAALGLYLTWGYARPWSARFASMTVGERGLTIDYPGLLLSPIDVPVRYVRLAAVEMTPGKGPSTIFHKAQELFQADPATLHTLVDKRRGRRPSGLYSSKRGSPLRMLGLVPDVPNLAVVFTQPLAFDSVRKGPKLWFGKSPSRPLPRRGEVRGFLATVEDPAQALTLFQRWGVVRPITQTDLDLVTPSDAERRRARTKSIAYVVLAVGFAFGARPLIDAILGPDPVCGREYYPFRSDDYSSAAIITPRAPGTELAPLLLAMPPAGDFRAEGVEGAIDLPAAATRHGHYWELGERELRKAGFVAGFLRDWNGSAHSLSMTILRFESSTGAKAFESWNVGLLDCIRYQAFAVPGVPGATGRIITSGSYDIYRIGFIRGPFRFSLAASVLRTQPQANGMAIARAAVTSQWRRILQQESIPTASGRAARHLRKHMR